MILVLLLVSTFFSRSSCVVDWSESKPRLCVNNETYKLQVGENKTRIYYKVIVTDLFDVSEERMEFGLQTLIFELWEDRSWTELNRDSIGFTPASIPKNIQSCLWQPDLIFPNCKVADMYKVTVPNVFLKVLPGGLILRYSRYHMIVSCHMSFIYYPMDTQICALNLTLFSHFADDVDLDWIPKKEDNYVMDLLYPPIEIIDGVKPLQFSLKRLKAMKHRIELTEDTHTNILVAEFYFVRHITAALVNTYVPSFLVVCLTMVSFWLDVTAVPGRVTLGVTALLTLTTMIVHARSSLPSVNYMTAIDVWLFGCLVMVFLSLIEFTMAQTMYRRSIRKDTNKEVTGNLTAWCSKESLVTTSGVVEDVCGNSDKEGPITSMRAMPRKKTLRKKNDNILDRVSRYLFPFVLLTFSSFYFVYYYNVAVRKQI